MSFPDIEAAYQDYQDGIRHEILDRESDAVQLFDDMVDGQRDSYLDSLEGPE